jgi:hypothetical protein
MGDLGEKRIACGTDGASNQTVHSKISPRGSVSFAATQMIDCSWRSFKDFLALGWHVSEKVDGHAKVSWTVLQLRRKKTVVCTINLLIPKKTL